MLIWKEWQRRGNAERHRLGLSGYVDTYTALCLFGILPIYGYCYREWVGVQ